MSEHHSQESGFDADLPDADGAEGSDADAQPHPDDAGNGSPSPEVSDEEVRTPQPESAPEDDPTGPGAESGRAPETGDLVIDAALRDLAEAPVDDLDAQIERGEQVQRTLQGRLSDLGG